MGGKAPHNPYIPCLPKGLGFDGMGAEPPTTRASLASRREAPDARPSRGGGSLPPAPDARKSSCFAWGQRTRSAKRRTRPAVGGSCFAWVGGGNLPPRWPCIRCLPSGGKGCTGCGGLCSPSHRTPTPSGGTGCKRGYNKGQVCLKSISISITISNRNEKTIITHRYNNSFSSLHGLHCTAMHGKWGVRWDGGSCFAWVGVRWDGGFDGMGGRAPHNPSSGTPCIRCSGEGTSPLRQMQEGAEPPTTRNNSTNVLFFIHLRPH